VFDEPWRRGFQLAARRRLRLRPSYAEAVGDISGHGLNANAHPAACHLSMILELSHDHFCGVGGNFPTIDFATSICASTE
jgi:hypothetical protein